MAKRRSEKPEAKFYVQVRCGIANWSVPSSHATIEKALKEAEILMLQYVHKFESVDIRIGHKGRK